jgi:hypothetical protein
VILSEYNKNPTLVNLDIFHQSHQAPASFNGGDEKPQEDTLKGRKKMDNSFKNLFGPMTAVIESTVEVTKNGKACNPYAFVR